MNNDSNLESQQAGQVPAPPPPSNTSYTVVTSVHQGSVTTTRSTLSGAANIVWLLFGGIWFAIAYVLAGIFACFTLIGIPFGIQSFKLAGYALWPFGRVVIQNSQRDAGLSTLGNVAWFIVGGWWLAILHLFLALIMAVTIIGLPLAAASVKMAGLALAPFGKKIVPLSSLNTMTNVVVVSSIG